MPRNITPEKAIAFTHYAVALSFCWPPSPSATKLQVFQFKVGRICLIINAFSLLVPLIYSMYLHSDDPGSIAKSVCLVISVVQSIVQTTYYITRYEHFQRIIENMNFYCENASPGERVVLQNYVNKYYMFYGASAMWFYLAVVALILGPMVTSDQFPSNAEYPFAVDYEPVRSIIFVHQSLAGFQCAAHVCLCVFYALLALFSAARFQILMDELRAVKDVGELVECFKMYNSSKRYADEMINGIRYTVMFVVFFCLVVAVFCGINFILQQSATLNIQFAFITANAFMEVFVCARAADHLLQISTNVMDALYESEWQGRDLELQKTILIAILPVSPVSIKVTCLIPEFSLNYYCAFVSNVFSLFTTLRVFLVKDED